MSDPVSARRALAARVAKLLREKSRNDEAVLILAGCAAAGPNNPEGQELLAEALRIDPNAAVAQAAFSRMEGFGGPDSALDQAIAQYDTDALTTLEKSLRPVFRRAQVGFNNNLKYKGAVYHVQTEDSGLDKPHIITHLFADGGRIIKSHKRSYANFVERPDVPTFVRALMKGQHMEMVLSLREGTFDGVIAGTEKGGISVLDYAPKVDIAKIGSRKGPRPPAQVKVAQSATPAAPAVASSPAADAPHRFSLHVLRSLSGGPERYDPRGDEVVLGASGDVKLEGEIFCHPREAMIVHRDGKMLIEDIEGGNGVFLRIRRRVELSEGDEFMVGDQLLRLERNPTADDGPDPGPTYFRSSMKGASTFRVTQIFEGGALGACAMARETTLQIGSVIDDFYANDLVLRDDPLIDPYHCVIEEQAEAFVLADFGARSGVFVRVVGSQELQHGDELLVGRTRLQVDLSASDAALAALG